jgi:hypothetical protein
MRSIAAHHACRATERGARRSIKHVVLGAVILLLALPVTAGANSPARSHDDDPGQSGGGAPQAGNWRTFVLGSGATIAVAPPPARRSPEAAAELTTLEADQLAREASPAIQASIAKWDAQPAFAPWTQKALTLIASNGTSTTKAQRVMALVHIAMYDATVAAWHWKSVYRRTAPAQVDRCSSPQLRPQTRPRIRRSTPCSPARPPSC